MSPSDAGRDQIYPVTEVAFNPPPRITPSIAEDLRYAAQCVCQVAGATTNREGYAVSKRLIAFADRLPAGLDTGERA